MSSAPYSWAAWRTESDGVLAGAGAAEGVSSGSSGSGAGATWLILLTQLFWLAFLLGFFALVFLLGFFGWFFCLAFRCVFGWGLAGFFCELFCVVLARGFMDGLARGLAGVLGGGNGWKVEGKKCRSRGLKWWF